MRNSERVREWHSYTYRNEVGNMLREALISDVPEMLPMLTNTEASATVVTDELDQYMPRAQEPAAKRHMATNK